MLLVVLTKRAIEAIIRINGRATVTKIEQAKRSTEQMVVATLLIKALVAATATLL